jgi:hypothetical protein
MLRFTKIKRGRILMSSQKICLANKGVTLIGVLLTILAFCLLLYLVAQYATKGSSTGSSRDANKPKSLFERVRSVVNRVQERRSEAGYDTTE